MKAKSISNLVEKLNDSAELKQKFENNPMDFLETVSEEPPIANKWVFLTIVIIVGTCLLTSIILGGIIIFDVSADDRQNAKVPEFLVSIGATALGALVGLLSPSPTATK
ncbi:MAG: hypothetical protein M0D53_04190 [Flavobacterium sp. JAD_PAG50586_2]|nr:MAG: hypothetical protein M0D53_04190 [Flavobacterium sp. JAD_PAG50586_2]